MNYRRNLTTLRRPCGLETHYGLPRAVCRQTGCQVQSGRIDSNAKGGYDDTDSATDFVGACPTPCTRTPVIVRLR
jgi:hypothetical protein